MIGDGETASGSVTTVLRVGDTIRRPCGRWTPVVHALLAHLESAGFTRAPRALGIDAEGREILSFLPGETARRPWPPALTEPSGIVALATWLAEYHAAVRDFRPPAGADWFVPGLTWREGQIIRHGDLGPWNSVWQGTELAGFIDWDFAEPGEPIEDLAHLAWYAVPLRGPAPGARERLELLCSVYGAEPVAVLDALAGLQRRERERIVRLGTEGIAPWDSFLERGDVRQIDAEAAWLAGNRESLL
ncbi:aminoglycoside phosphotransferase family protein [Longispora albida]|uniref:aminoglycoside phosphotransferase family protein n=1 Tax=Longispora albida TaxID=203523 RepID=UPI00035D92D2|nr:aminoglycoside phosphotransferase family protein [Longispora albida]